MTIRLLSAALFVAILALAGALVSPALAHGGGVKAVIDKSEQRMQVWKGDTLLYTWPASTGKKSAYTPTGTFYVQRYWAGEHNSSKYGTKMIDTVYYDGTRAIHGIDDPDKLALIGVQGVSMGCTVLSPQHAKIFFDLARSHKTSQVKIVIQQ